MGEVGSVDLDVMKFSTRKRSESGCMPLFRWRLERVNPLRVILRIDIGVNGGWKINLFKWTVQYKSLESKVVLEFTGVREK